GYDQAQLERAHEAARYAFAALERLGGNEELRAFLLSHLGLVLTREGKYSEALEQHQRALEIRERMRGPAAFQLSASLNNIGIVFAQTGRSDRALEYLQRSLAIKEEMVGAEHPSVLAPLGNLGLLFFLQGKYERSLYYAERALTLSQKAF